ncbi:MAG: response regulator [Candidatus Omnitrophota bacterium]|nr:response regulator [Candidatus Omnitrophota bacterium]
MFRDVLIADSNVDSRDRFYEILFSIGHKVECAPNSSEAIIRLQAERPYLLILDQDLIPDGGLKTLEQIRKFDKEIRVVFLTKNEPDAEVAAKAHRLGVSEVLKKDFSGHIMFKKILGILREVEEKIKEDKYANLGKILVVDDSPEMRITLTTFLMKKGFDVKDVVNGEQALMEIKVEKPKIILLDERMPGMDGLMVLRKIKELDKLINVVMLTAVEDEDIIKEAIAQGACDYLTKPCNLQEVEALILSILMQEKYKQ